MRIEGELHGDQFHLRDVVAGFEAHPESGVGLRRCRVSQCSATDVVTIGLPIFGQGALTVGDVTFPQVFNDGNISILGTTVTLPSGRFIIYSQHSVKFRSFAQRPSPEFPVVFGPVFFAGQGTFSTHCDDRRPSFMRRFGDRSVVAAARDLVRTGER